MNTVVPDLRTFWDANGIEIIVTAVIIVTIQAIAWGGGVIQRRTNMRRVDE